MSHDLDLIDEQIVALLRQNGRRGNRELARALGVTEATIRKRMKRLLDDGVMQVIAVTSPLRRGYSIDVVFELRVDFDKLMEVANRLVALEEVRYLTISTGIHNIRAAVLFRSADELSRFMTETLASMPGIRQVDSSISLCLLKHTYDWVPVATTLTAADVTALEGAPEVPDPPGP